MIKTQQTEREAAVMGIIYILEDDANIREIETYALKNSGYEVASFERASEFYDAASRRIPDLVILDIMLPDEDGLSVLRNIRQDPEMRERPVIFVSAKATELDAVRGLDSGADDYITKPFGVMELISRVKAILRRTGHAPENEVLSLGEIRVEPAKRICAVNERGVELTFKEFELLTCLLRNAGIVLTREVLMNRVWGVDFEGESRTLDMHIKKQRQNVGDAREHSLTVRNVGYIAK